MSKKRLLFWPSFTLLFFLVLSSILISTIYHAAISTNGEQDETEKKISQNVQQELSNLVSDNDELSAALSKEQEKTSTLETQLNDITQKYHSLEQSNLVQTTLIEAHWLCDYGNYKESQQKLLSLVSAQLSESEVQVFNSVSKAITKKGYRMTLR